MIYPYKEALQKNHFRIRDIFFVLLRLYFLLPNEKTALKDNPGMDLL